MNYFDLHCDTISECCNNKESLYKNSLQLSVERGGAIDQWVQTYAIWMDDELNDQEAYDQFNKVYDYFISEVNNPINPLAFCKSGKEIEKNLALGKRVALLAIEGSRAVGEDIDKVQEVYDKGVRMMTLTWNGKSPVGDGCMVENAGGLTPFGKRVVCKMEELGMIVDVSHLSEKGFWDVAAITQKPFIATHSNSKAICDHPRNLTDEQFEVIRQRSGLVGMNYYSLFINGTSEGKIDELINHVDHLIELGGEDVIAMGSDFDGAKMPEHMKGIQDVGYLYKRLVKRYGQNRSEKFYFENAKRFCLEYLK